MSQTALEKFQQLLRELFEFDMADLDFGIYRIMNHKRKIIEDWIEKDLPDNIRKELAQGALAAQQQAQQALAEARKKVLDTLGETAIDAEGNLDEQYRNSKVGREYLEAQERAAHTQSTEALEAAVYNHLYAFFSRYWQEGDFISKRRYSRKERYAIPYNGEEVYLYWANHDQYYVKTGEHFTDYTWKSPNGVTVHFKIKAADVEQNNVKGEKRFFLPRTAEITWNDAARQLIIPFEYRPLTAQETITYGQKNQQESIIAKAVTEIPGRVKAPQALAALNAERRKTEKGEIVTYLEHHLRQYTARNTRDFFIHRDLRGFLSRELDFYLKNEVLNLEEMEAAGENLAEGWFELLRLIKRVGNHIIAFLAQVEDFQKMLWEKKKFVTETFYVITLGNIPDSFYADIAACEAQWEEWRELLSVQAPKNVAERIGYLKQHPTLPLDTRHFSPDFTDRLLASFENLDEMTDGLLVHSENWQALNLLQEKYRERVKCIYIDPPYNTGNDEFLYRDNYQHSSWLAMMSDRIILGGRCSSKNGGFFISIDYNEDANLRLLLNQLLSPECYRNTIIPSRVKKSIMEREQVKALNWGTGYLMFFAISDETSIVPPRRVNNGQRKEKWHAFDAPGIRPTMEYEVFGRKPPAGRHWMYSKEIAMEMIKQGNLRMNPRTGNIQYKVPYSTGVILDTNWTDVLESDSAWGFVTEKNVRFLQRAFGMVSNRFDVLLDYFAGSGTTAHAVINLNREDGGRRKFILVEMAEYFDTVLLPRIKKVTFTPEWKDGKPKRMAKTEEAERSPRIVKVIRLESYEDTLNNLSFDEESGPKALELFKEDYLLSYMLKWETRRSETLLNVEQLQSPFSYKLRIHRDGETREQPVDLPETFNYLIGLDVEKRQVLDDGGRRYLLCRGTTRDGRRTAVIWRETRGWTEDDYRRDRDFVTVQKLTEVADDVFINGDSLIPGARALEGVFKAKMFGQTE